MFETASKIQGVKVEKKNFVFSKNFENYSNYFDETLYMFKVSLKLLFSKFLKKRNFHILYLCSRLESWSHQIFVLNYYI